MKRQDLIFRVFVSSPFSDMAAERNRLQEEVFPKLREYCQQRGTRFQAIDLRWGVGQEAALDQQTMNICLRELRRCQELSPRPNFIVLLGDRYGWRPLPPQVEAGEFEALLARITKETDKDRVKDWYQRDDDAVPAEYCLLPRAGEFADLARWAQEESEVRAILLTAVEQVLPPDDTRRRKWFDSATHQEIRHGALEADKPQDHVFCYFREIDGLPEDGSAARYRDIRDGGVDVEASRRLDALKTDLRGLLPPNHVHEYRAAWGNGQPERNADAWNAFCEDVKRDLKQIIDQEVAAFRRRPDLDREAESHQEFAEDRCRHFVGRQDILHRIGEYLASADNKPLVIHGKSGSGKTALMAKAALDLAKSATKASQAVLFHFIGATPASCDLRSLLMLLCRRMGITDVPSDMNELVKAFRDRLSPPSEGETESGGRQPVVLFLDALDQLNPTDNARMLYWLPRELAPGVKMVMSVLEPESPEEKPADRYEDSFGIAGRIWPDRMVEIGPLDEASAATLLRTWLTEAGRELRGEQEHDVPDKFKACPRPLFLKLAFEEARRWKSWEPLPCGPGGAPGLSNSINGVLGDLFHRLEQPRNHGRLLVSCALGYIAAGKNGLTEDELIDVLSSDKDVMADFFKRSPDSPKIDRLPVVVWSRLFADIEAYMTRRRADGTIVMDFYHRQVGEAAAKRYLTGDARVQAHLHLAEYFHKLDYWAEPLEAQRARAKRLPPTPRPANVRKVVELPYHRLEVAKLAGKDDPKSPYWDAVADLLLDWQFLEAKTEADPNFREQESKEPSPTPGKPEP